MFYSHFESPIGKLLLAGRDDGLRLVGFTWGSKAQKPQSTWQRHDAAFGAAKRQLTEYFAGSRRSFDLALAAQGTAFQQKVWEALGAIPYGETRSYKDIANAIGQPRATQAVGGANACNPLAILVPCHRVVGANGSLTGYGGGLDAKQYLLNLEACGQSSTGC